jgi:hypothetical protein
MTFDRLDHLPHARNGCLDDSRNADARHAVSVRVGMR